jgi:hypothetical protein
VAQSEIEGFRVADLVFVVVLIAAYALSLLVLRALQAR